MKTLTTAALALGLAASALAQPGPGMMGPGQMAGDDRQGMGMMGGGMGMCSMMGARRSEGTLAFLKTELKITAAQEKNWDAFAAVYGEAKTAPMPMKPGGMMGGGKPQPLPERMTQHEQMMEARLAAMKSMHVAIAPLYASLSAEQKRTADEILPMAMMCRI
jgi:hypothetical protein